MNSLERKTIDAMAAREEVLRLMRTKRQIEDNLMVARAHCAIAYAALDTEARIARKETCP